MVKDQRADINEHPSVLQDSFDLGDQRVIDLERLDRSKSRLSEQRPCCSDRVDSIGLLKTSTAPLRSGPLRGDRDEAAAGGHVAVAECDERWNWSGLKR